MIVTERERQDLVKKLEDALGSNAAATLMEYLPAAGWRDVATVTDLDHVRVLLTSDLEHARAVLSGQVDSGIGELRAEVKADIGELRIGLADVRTELRTGLADVRTELARQTQRLAMAFVGAMVSFGGLVVAAAAITRP